MSRYIERAEHTSRLVEVNLKQMLDESPEVSGRRWERVVNCLRTDPPSKGDREAWVVASWMMLDLANPDSIASCVAAARENARQVRETISTEMWEALNRLHLYVKASLSDASVRRDPHEFLRRVKLDIHVLHGISDSTVVHGEGWMFLQAGKSVERAAATTALLHEHIQDFLALDLDKTGAEVRPDPQGRRGGLRGIRERSVGDPHRGLIDQDLSTPFSLLHAADSESLHSSHGSL